MQLSLQVSWGGPWLLSACVVLGLGLSPPAETPTPTLRWGVDLLRGGLSSWVGGWGGDDGKPAVPSSKTRVMRSESESQRFSQSLGVPGI